MHASSAQMWPVAWCVCLCVSPSVGHTGELCKCDGTDWDAIQKADSRGAKEPGIGWGVHIRWIHSLSQWVTRWSMALCQLSLDTCSIFNTDHTRLLKCWPTN